MTNVIFGPWEPDSAGHDTGVLAVARNVYPQKVGYGPIPALASYGTDSPFATDPCVGACYARTSSGGWIVFAGTRSKLYRLIGKTWTDVSRTSGGAYNVPVDEYWSFTQFGAHLIAVNINDDPQVLNVDSGSTSFSALGGNPPRSRYVAVVGDFVVLACQSGDATRRITNSAINDSEGWTVGVGLCDEQEFPDGGRITGLAGGEFGWVVQEKAIRQMIFQPGSDYAFRFQRVEQERGAASGYSLQAVGQRIFFISDDGFYMMLPGATPVAIGAQRVNEWFRDESDTSFFFSTISFVDPTGPRVCWAFKSTGAGANLDRVIVYDWSLDRWSYAEVEAQFWVNYATPGTALEGLDVYGSIDGGGIPYPFDSRVWEGGRPAIGAIDVSGGLSFLEGSDALAALLVTGVSHFIPGRRAFINSVHPMGTYEASTLALRIGKQESADKAVTWAGPVAPSPRSGLFRLRASARQHTMELSITQTSGNRWRHAQGLLVDVVEDGEQ